MKQYGHLLSQILRSPRVGQAHSSLTHKCQQRPSASQLPKFLLSFLGVMVLTRKFVIIDSEIIKLMEAYHKEGCGVISPQILLPVIEGKVTQKLWKCCSGPLDSVG